MDEVTITVIVVQCSLSLSSHSGFGSLDDAVRAAVKQGIHVSVSAGNYWVNACTITPGRVHEVYVLLNDTLYN